MAQNTVRGDYPRLNFVTQLCHPEDADGYPRIMVIHPKKRTLHPGWIYLVSPPSTSTTARIFIGGMLERTRLEVCHRRPTVNPQWLFERRDLVVKRAGRDPPASSTAGRGVLSFPKQYDLIRCFPGRQQQPQLTTTTANEWMSSRRINHRKSRH